MNVYITGKQLCEKYKMLPIELLDLVSNTGLQPLTSTRRPIPPPDIKKIRHASMSIMDAEVIVGFRLNKHPAFCIEEIEKQRGNLETWRGFNFDNCVGGLFFNEDERITILKNLASDETLYLIDEVKELIKAPKKGKRITKKATHDQKSKAAVQKYAFKVWHKEKREITKTKLIEEILAKDVSLTISGEPYAYSTIENWLTNIKNGKVKSPFS